MYKYEVTSTVKTDIENVVGKPLFYLKEGKYYINGDKRDISIQYWHSATDSFKSETLDQICQTLYSTDFDAQSTQSELKDVELVQATPFASNDVVFKGNGVIAEVDTGKTTDIDFKVTFDALLNGGILQTIGESFGDYFQAQVVDVDNLLGQGANFVVNTWIDKWYALLEDKHLNLTTPQAGDIPNGFWLRIKYTSVAPLGGTKIKVIVNYKLNIAANGG